MNKGIVAFALAAPFAAGLAAAPPPPAHPSPLPETPVVSQNYQVGPGDLLDISVWGEEKLVKQALIRPDGGMSFPLVGDLQVGGQTIEQIRAGLTRRLADYFSDPVVHVSLATINQKIYVVGKVNKPGEFLVPENVSVIQALSMAGGLTPFADNDDIMIIRKVGGKEITFLFDYGDVSGGDGLEQNIVLQRGDVVVVP